eukprot:6850130-Pyramimonas_sp.AAC.1
MPSSVARRKRWWCSAMMLLSGITRLASRLGLAALGFENDVCRPPLRGGGSAVASCAFTQSGR